MGDIEIVAIPREEDEHDLFSSVGRMRVDAWSSLWLREHIGTIVKGDPRRGRYIQLRHTDSALQVAVQVDLFLANPANWGLILAIRTGSADYAHHVLANGWSRRGWHSVEGMLCNPCGAFVSTPEEADVFRIAGVALVDPGQREVLQRVAS